MVAWIRENEFASFNFPLYKKVRNETYIARNGFFFCIVLHCRAFLLKKKKCCLEPFKHAKTWYNVCFCYFMWGGTVQFFEKHFFSLVHRGYFCVRNVFFSHCGMGFFLTSSNCDEIFRNHLNVFWIKLAFLKNYQNLCVYNVLIVCSLSFAQVYEWCECVIARSKEVFKIGQHFV